MLFRFSVFFLNRFRKTVRCHWWTWLPLTQSTKKNKNNQIVIAAVDSIKRPHWIGETNYPPANLRTIQSHKYKWRGGKQFNNADKRVYKKTSPNSVLTLYLGTRDIICRHGKVEPLRGVIFVDPKYVANHKIYGQLTLTFR